MRRLVLAVVASRYVHGIVLGAAYYACANVAAYFLRDWIDGEYLRRWAIQLVVGVPFFLVAIWLWARRKRRGPRDPFDPSA